MSSFNWRLKDWGIELSDEVDLRLRIYAEELVKFNRRINLVSPKTLDFADAVHFADSLLAGQIVLKKHNKNNILVDIGSGNGFPGLVMAAAHQGCRFELFDIDERKVEFLKHVISKMKIANCKAFVRDASKLEGQSLQSVVMRGFAAIPKALEMLAPALQAGSDVFFLKSEHWLDEVTLSQHAASQSTGGVLAGRGDGLSVSAREVLVLGFHGELIGEYTQPVSNAKMVVLRFRKRP